MLGDVRVQRMFLGVVGKSRKMPGRQETTHWQTSALLLVRPGPPNNNSSNNNKQANAAPGKEQKNNKRKQTTRNEKRKKQMQIQARRVRSGTVTVWTAIICCCLFWRYSTVWLWQCGCEYCHYLFMPQNVSFSFSFGQGSQRCCWLKET